MTFEKLGRAVEFNDDELAAIARFLRSESPSTDRLDSLIAGLSASSKDPEFSNRNQVRHLRKVTRESQGIQERIAALAGTEQPSAPLPVVLERMSERSRETVRLLDEFQLAGAATVPMRYVSEGMRQLESLSGQVDRLQSCVKRLAALGPWVFSLLKAFGLS